MFRVGCFCIVFCSLMSTYFYCILPFYLSLLWRIIHTFFLYFFFPSALWPVDKDSDTVWSFALITGGCIQEAVVLKQSHTLKKNASYPLLATNQKVMRQKDSHNFFQRSYTLSSFVLLLIALFPPTLSCKFTPLRPAILVPVCLPATWSECWPLPLSYKLWVIHCEFVIWQTKPCKYKLDHSVSRFDLTDCIWAKFITWSLK